MNRDPDKTLRTYRGKEVTIRGDAPHTRILNETYLSWEYAHDDPIESWFSVTCRIDKPDLNVLAKVDEKSRDSEMTVRGILEPLYVNLDFFEVDRGGLLLSVYLKHCNVIAIETELMPGHLLQIE